MAKKKNYYQTQTGNMIKAGVGTMVGIGLIGATAPMVAALPVGTARTMAGTAVGLQGVALLGPNLKLVNDSFGDTPRRRRARR